jgi:hypothetical protein
MGKGIGRYGTSQFSDVYEKSDGTLQGISETAILLGLTFHATPKLDIYAYAGQERAQSSSYATTIGTTTTQGGYGNPLFSNLGGCEVGAAGGQLACNGNTKFAQEATIGFWNKAFSGDYGSFRIGLQYSYTKRESFTGVVDNTVSPSAYGTVKGDDNMIYTSIRFYPFQK